MIIWQRFQKLCSVFPPCRFNFLGCFSYLCVSAHISDCLPLSLQMSSYKRATLEEEEASDVPAEAASSPDRVEVSERGKHIYRKFILFVKLRLQRPSRHSEVATSQRYREQL